MKTKLIAGIGIFLAAVVALAACDRQESFVIGSKLHTESHILGEVLAQSLEAAGYAVERKFKLGGTKIVFNALQTGEIHGYVEYSGTLEEVILKASSDLTLDDIRHQLAQQGIQSLDPLGFNNSYAFGVHQDLAEKLELRTISDLRSHPQLRFYFSHEFLERQDGYPNLQARYNLPQTADGIEHALALRAIVEEEIDVTDLYTTDAEIKHFSLVILEDDLSYFPQYLALPIVRSDLPDRVKEVMNVAGNALDNELMSHLNYQVHIEGKSPAETARDFLATLGVDAPHRVETLGERVLERTLEHLYLAFIALALATVIALSISFAVYSIPWLARPVTYIAGLLQTIPSLALLALMVPLFGIGTLPAIVALFLYSLLPIIRTTITALTTLDPLLIQVAEGTGYTRGQVLRLIQIPLALPAIFAGIRISAIICIGTATLAAFIGGGGLGDLIFQGLQLDDTRLILIGAGTAALMAIIVELAFEAMEKTIIPGHISSANQPQGKPIQT